MEQNGEVKNEMERYMLLLFGYIMKEGKGLSPKVFRPFLDPPIWKDKSMGVLSGK